MDSIDYSACRERPDPNFSRAGEDYIGAADGVHTEGSLE